MTEHLRAALAALMGVLQHDITAGELTMEIPGGRRPVRFAKAAYPCVSLSATPDFATGQVEVRLTRGGDTASAPTMEQLVSCVFVLTEELEAALRLNGETYTDPAEAARGLVERAFRAPG